MCSVATTPVASPEFDPIRCATTLCHFGQTRNGYVTTHFIVLIITAERSATSGYAVVLQRFGQNADPASRNLERTRKKNLVPSSTFNRCNMYTQRNRSFSIFFMCFLLCIFLIFTDFFSTFL